MAELETLAELMGLSPLLPWQKLVLEVLTEQDEEGRPWYRDGVVTVPRQCGKSEVVLGLLVLDRLLLWPTQPQRVVWAAQDLGAGIASFQDKIVPKLEAGPLMKEFGLRFASAQANPYLYSARTGSRVTITGQSDTKVHGRTLGLIVADEIWALPDSSRDGGMRPALRTVKDSQMVFASTAGDSTSTYFREKVEAGRARVEAGTESQSAFFEWSGDENDDHTDPKIWAKCVPALGWTIDERALSHDLEEMSETDFRRTTLNQWVETMFDPVIPWEFYERAIAGSGQQVGGAVWGVDASPLLDHVAIVSAAPNGVVFTEQEWGNVHSVVEYVLDNRREFRAIAGMKNGPLHDELVQIEKRGVRVWWYGNVELGLACGTTYDKFLHEQVRLVGTGQSLRSGLAAAVRREGGASGRWVWWHHDTTKDVSFASLWAMTMALHGADRLARTPEPAVFFLDDDTAGDLGVVASGDEFNTEVDEWLKMFGEA